MGSVTSGFQRSGAADAAPVCNFPRGAVFWCHTALAEAAC